MEQAEQAEQPNQSALLEHLLTFFFSLLDDVITQDGVRCVKTSPDPFTVDITRFRKAPTAIHFGWKSD